MDNLEFISNLGYIGVEIYILKLFFISICTYYTFLKILNIRPFINGNLIFTIISTLITTILCGLLKYKTNSFTSILCLISFLSGLYSILTKNKVGFSILISIISLSINYILFYI